MRTVPGIRLPWIVRALVAVAAALALAGLSQAAQARGWSTADHSKFKELQGPFANAEEVTKACLSCHTKAAKQIHATTHWKWKFDNPRTGQQLGKGIVINNFCGAIGTNEPFCAKCHIGYGMKDYRTFDFTSETKVDCLVCHAQAKDYIKFPGFAGHPLYEPTKIKGKLRQPPDLAKVAQSVGPTSRFTCGARCHFVGGGGNGVKHGDLDLSLVNPPEYLDVHMSPKRLNFSCAVCHKGDEHSVAGSRYNPRAVDKRGIVVPGKGDETRTSCVSCHGDKPHSDAYARLNEHTDKLACQTCHIPYFARGGYATKMWWDWSTATKEIGEDGHPVHKYDAKGYEIYRTGKGSFRWEEFVKPEYRWFNGEVTYTLFGDPVEDGQKVSINRIGGTPAAEDSRIWPFKIMRGKQAIDAGNRTLAVVHLWGPGDDRTALWKGYDWDAALRVGMKSRGVEYSGKLGFVETEMYWPITHMVAPKEDALKCEECHSSTSRMAGLAGIYVPGYSKWKPLDTLGFGLAFLALVGVLGHGAMRIITHYREKRS